MTEPHAVSLLRSLCEIDADFIHDAGSVVFTRHGREYELALHELAGVGEVLRTQIGDYQSIEAFCQTELLDLPRLASQVCLSLEKEKARRPADFVDASAVLEEHNHTTKWNEVCDEFQQYILSPPVGSTLIIELMARAGQGKTVLLEQMAIERARNFEPASSPMPILLPIDLLGRFVGSVDDAIAGELSNRYYCPGLTQRDVIECLRRRWLVLALDGFDELASRIGIREAFLRVGELGTQLQGAGTVILSARDSFFELFQVEAAIAQFLQPRSGSYHRVSVKLEPWARRQGVQVFEDLGAEEPEAEFDLLMKSFSQDQEVVLHPFFLTRLATLWTQGERFEGASKFGLARTKYVVETFIERESQEKWTRPGEGQMILSKEEHAYPLGGVAEEMWRSSSMLLDEEEIRISGEVGLVELDLPRATRREVLDRLPTHCAFVPSRESMSQRFRFIHERFLHYFLGHRLALLLVQRRLSEWKPILAAGELDPEIIAWVVWFVIADENTQRCVDSALDAVSSESEETLNSNLGSLLAGIAQDKNGKVAWPELQGLIFVGEAWRDAQVQGLVFRKCRFWQIDLRSTVFKDCHFENCAFGDTRIDRFTRLAGSEFIQCEVSSIRGGRWGSVFSPEEVDEALKSHGAEVKDTRGHGKRTASGVSKEFSACLEKVLYLSIRSTDQETNELEERLGRIAKAVVRLGLESGILSDIKKPFSGKGKRFIRFQVDKEMLLRGQAERTGIGEVDKFWEAARQLHPSATAS